jgi:hypothetical protein
MGLLGPAVKAAVVENLDMKYRNRSIYILSDSQPTDHLKAGLGLATG